MPKRHGFGRQGSAAAHHQFQPVEAELVEDRLEYGRLNKPIDCVLHQVRAAAPAPGGIGTGKAHGEVMGGALDPARIENADQYV